MNLVRAFFGSHGQLGVGTVVFIVGVGLWTLGVFVIPGAAAVPWKWSPSVFIFHASMFYGQVACFSIVSGALGYRATERVETAVVENIENAGEVNVNPE